MGRVLTKRLHILYDLFIQQEMRKLIEELVNDGRVDEAKEVIDINARLKEIAMKGSA